MIHNMIFETKEMEIFIIISHAKILNKKKRISRVMFEILFRRT